MCIHAFRQTIEYYKQNSSPVFICWYRTQRFNVQWGGFSSKCFSAANGVPQGGIISPWLFNIYIDDLSISLSNANAGCKFGGMYVNHFSYADDMAILSPSASGLQKLLNIWQVMLLNMTSSTMLRKHNAWLYRQPNLNWKTLLVFF